MVYAEMNQKNNSKQIQWEHGKKHMNFSLKLGIIIMVILVFSGCLMMPTA